MSEWISVEERLPEEGDLVILGSATENKTIGVGALTYDFPDDEEGYWRYENYVDINYEVTHWQPLPRAPK